MAAVAIAVAGAVAGALAGVMSGVGMYMQSAAQAQALAYNEQVAAYQAEQARQRAALDRYNAMTAREQAEINTKKANWALEGAVGEMRAKVAKSQLQGPTTLEVELDFASQALYDIELIGWEGERESMMHLYSAQLREQEADLKMSEAGFLGQQASQTQMMGAVAMGSTILGAFGSATSSLSNIGGD